MRFFFFIILSTLFAMEIFPQNINIDREPVAAGRYYSADPATLKNDLKQLFSAGEKADEMMDIRAIISPHAGYVFSGEVAASAFSAIPENRKYKNIFLIGSSHVMAFDGASVYNTGDYITPLGKIKVNREIANAIRNSSPLFSYRTDAHIQEHSLEVQIPFIQYYFEDPPQIVPIIIGTNNIDNIRAISEALRPYFTEDNLFVISSDFSHYPPYNRAKQVDKVTADAIITKDPDAFLDALRKNASRSISGLVTSMCGWTSGLLLLYLAEDDPDLVFEKISYCNSGDTPYGNKEEVVGYNAIILKNKKNSSPVANNSSGMTFSDDEAQQLIGIARASIRTMLYDNSQFNIDPDKMPPSLRKNMGAFVTLKINGVLRGCIGRFISTEPLCEVVRQMALASAFEDHRFTPLTKAEFNKIEIEISVLSPMRKISDISEIVLGRHGIYITKDLRSGTMLPQVATENNWTVEQFLGYTSRDKAGLGWDGWKDADIYVYEAAVLEEKHK